MIIFHLNAADQQEKQTMEPLRSCIVYCVLDSALVAAMFHPNQRGTTAHEARMFSYSINMYSVTSVFCLLIHFYSYCMRYKSSTNILSVW